MEHCAQILTPTQIVLLGATGDLTQKKLLSALLDLYARSTLPERLHIIAFSRDSLTTKEYRAFARTHIAKKKHGHDEAMVTDFLQHIEYVSGTFDDKDSFHSIKEALTTYDTSIGMCTSKLFYLAVPPSFYDTIFEQIAYTGLDLPCAEGEGWVRILVEKPFGSDLDNAHRLEDKLSVLFKEEQIYRIDHYLAKDALQNILAFRFSNILFEDKWNKDYVEGVYIRVFEKFDVASRGAFFDGVGALRDVGQNHMLQMLALIAMDRPDELRAEALRAKRAEVLRTLHIPDEKSLTSTVVKGQYNGYTQVPNVASDSKTETYFALKTFLDSPRWADVPFYLEHGKAMTESNSEITVRFRSAENCVCDTHAPHNHPSFVRFTISPEQKITVRFWVRKPGLKYELEPNDLVFDRAETAQDNDMVLSDAYEEVLFNAICGDQTLFVSSAEQAAAWKYVTAILTAWKDTAPSLYDAGGAGPATPLQKEIQDTFTNL